MGRRRPVHGDDMVGRADRKRLRKRRRRRRLARGAIKSVFWTIVLIGVFILGLGYGRTLSGDDTSTSKRVTIDQTLGTVEATLPTKTVTVTTAAPAARRATPKR